MFPWLTLSENAPVYNGQFILYRYTFQYMFCCQEQKWGCQIHDYVNIVKLMDERKFGKHVCNLFLMYPVFLVRIQVSWFMIPCKSNLTIAKKTQFIIFFCQIEKWTCQIQDSVRYVNMMEEGTNIIKSYAIHVTNVSIWHLSS